MKVNNNSEIFLLKTFVKLSKLNKINTKIGKSKKMVWNKHNCLLSCRNPYGTEECLLQLVKTFYKNLNEAK